MADERGRASWRFHMHAGKVKDAAQRLVDYHAKHLIYWEAQEARLNDEIQAKGVSLTAQDVTGGKQWRANIDSVLGAELATAGQHKYMHQQQKQEFEAWVYALDTQRADDVLILVLEDVSYFKIGRDLEDDLPNG